METASQRIEKRNRHQEIELLREATDDDGKFLVEDDRQWAL